MKRFSIVQTGYDINEVNRFIDVVINRLEKLSNENTILNNEIKRIKTENNNNEINNQNLSKALIAVQEATNKMKEMAQNEANMIIEEAKRNASSIVHEALVTAQRTENESDILKKNIMVHKSKLKTQIEILSKLIEESDEF